MTQFTRSIPRTEILKVPQYDWYRLRMRGLMLFADLAGLTLAVVFGHLLTADTFNFHFFSPAEVDHLLMLGIILFVFMTSRLYPGVGIDPAEEIKLVTQYSSSALIIGMMVNIVLHPAWLNSAITMLSIWALSIINILLMRWSMHIAATQARIWGEPVAVLARGAQVDELTRYFLQRRRLGFVPVLAATDTGGRMAIEGQVPVVSLNSLITGSSTRLLRGVETILIDASFFGQNFTDNSCNRLSSIFRHIIFVSDMGWFEGASLAVRDFEGLIGIEARRNLLDPVGSAIKRIVDISGCVLGMLLFSPFLLLVQIGGGLFLALFSVNLAALFPAFKISRQDPAIAMRE